MKSSGKKFAYETVDLYTFSKSLFSVANGRRHLRGLRYMAKLGWYVWPDAPGYLGGAVWDAHRVEGASRSEIDQLLDEMATKDASRTFDYVIQVWPDRSQVITAARRRYEAGDWATFIPTALAQADGMSKEVFKDVQLFYGKAKSRQRSARAWISAHSPRLGALFALQFGANTKWHKPQEGAATRHDILHGLRIDYDTRINANQALLMMGYLSMLRQTKKKLHDV